MFEVLMTEKQKKLRDEVRDLAADVPLSEKELAEEIIYE